MNPSWKKDYVRYKAFFLTGVGHYRKRGDIRAYLEILLSLITISIFSVFALRPTILTISTLIKEIENKENILTMMNDKIQSISATQVSYDRERNNLRLLDIAIPDKPSPEIWVRQLEGLAEKHRVSVLSAEMKPSSPGPTSDAMEISVQQSAVGWTATISGNYENLLEYMKDVERLRTATLIQSYNFNLPQEEDRASIILTLDAVFVYLLTN
jgi:type IV pilus assembly protein PilO